MNIFPLTKRLAGFYFGTLKANEVSAFDIILMVFLPTVLTALIAMPVLSVTILQALLLSLFVTFIFLVGTVGKILPQYWLVYGLPAIVADCASYPFRLLYAKYMNDEARGSRLFNGLVAGSLDKKKIQPHLIGYCASVFTRNLIKSACAEIVRDQIGRDPLEVPNRPSVPRYERIEVVNEKLAGKIAYVHFEVECRIKDGPNDECKGAHFFARFELSADGLKIKKPAVRWVCDLESEKATQLEMAARFAGFIDEMDSEDSLSTHDPRQFMCAARMGLQKADDGEGIGSVSASSSLESE